MELKVGCAGWPISLRRYSEIFEVAEVQKTFYRLPKPETALRWRKEVRGDFEFTLKAPQLITHHPRSPTYRKAGITIPDEIRERYGFFRPTSEVFKVWEETLEITRILGTRVVLFQTPPSFRESEENIRNIRAFFKEIERGDLRLLWEPRGSWEASNLRALLKELDVTHVVDPFKARPLFGSLLYLRLHGREGGYRYRYSDEELQELLEMVNELGKGKEKAYLVFNNTNMLEDGKRFLQMLGGNQ